MKTRYNHENKYTLIVGKKQKKKKVLTCLIEDLEPKALISHKSGCSLIT